MQSIPITVEEYLNHARKTGIIWLGRLWVNPLSSFQIYDTLTISVNNPSISIDETKSIFAIHGISCSKYIIRSCKEWMSFISSCYALACVAPTDNWTTLGGKKTQFLEWIDDERVREKAEDPQQDLNKKSAFFKYDDGIFQQDNFLVTTYDCTKKKRLIIDGLHRAAALTMACEEHQTISEVNIVECLGDKVDILFPSDIHQL
jgi:hypothetical protein